jgi:hypothetical protein
MQLQSGDVLQTGTAVVTVFNPSPGGGESSGLNFTIRNPVPIINNLTPNTATVQGPGFTLTINGSGFIQGSIVQWNGSPRQTTFQNSTTLQATIPASDIATAGTAQVTVFNPSPGGGTSTSTSFTIGNPVPTINGLMPPSTTAQGPGFALTIIGSGFISGSTAQWNGSPRQTMFQNSTTLRAAIPASDIATAGTAQVTVFNPGPGGGTSLSSAFTISDSMPIIDNAFFSKQVPPYTILFQPVEVTVLGANFSPTSVARFDGADKPTNFISSTQIDFMAPVVSAAQALNSHSLTIFNPGPGGGTSNTVNLTGLDNEQPLIGSISPEFITRSTPYPATLSITGSNFTPGSIVSWNGSQRPTVVSSSTDLTFMISAPEITGLSPAMIIVFNPMPFSMTSAAFSYTIYETPNVTSLTPTNVTLLTPMQPTEITATGGPFTPTSIILFNGSPRPTTFINSSQVTFTLPEFMDDEAGVYNVTATNPPSSEMGGASMFAVNNPLPSLSSINPMTRPVGSGDFTLTVNGEKFVPSSVVRWNGSHRETNYVSSTQLNASIPASDIQTPVMVSVTVFTPGPGGGATPSGSPNFFTTGSFNFTSGD